MSITFARLRTPLLILACAASPAGAQQQFSARQAEGAVLALADTRLAVVMPANGRLEVVSLVGEATGPEHTDIQRGDVVLAVDGHSVSTFGDVTARFAAIEVGKPARVLVRRGTAERTITWNKPAQGRADGRQMVITSDAPSLTGGAGAWTVQGPPQGGSEVVIAGIHIRENSEGMPEVAFKSAHPGQAQVALQSGDVITALNGRSIAALAGLEKLYGEAAVGSDVRLTVTRRGTGTTISFKKPAS